MNTENYLMKIPDSSFLHIKEYLEKSDLYSIQKTCKDLQERTNNLFFTLYLLPEGHSMNKCHEVFFKDTISLVPCAQVIKENTLRHLILNLSQWKNESFPKIIINGLPTTRVISIKILFTLDWMVKNPLPDFMQKLKYNCFSTRKICLTPIGSEKELEDNLEVVKYIAPALQKDLLRTQQDFSLDEVSFDFPGYKLIASDALNELSPSNVLPVNANNQSILEIGKPTQSREQLHITIVDAIHWNYYPKAPELKECESIEDISIDYSQNRTTFESLQEIDRAILQTYNILKLTLDTGLYSQLKRIFLIPSFFDMQTIDREIKEIEQLIQYISFQGLQMTLNPTRLYEQMGENQGVLREKLETLQDRYGILIEEHLKPYSQRTYTVIAPQETLDATYCMNILEDISKNPQDLYFQLRYGQITLLNELLGTYSSIEKVSLKLYDEKETVHYNDIQPLYECIVELLTKFPNVQEFYFIPGRLKNDPDVEIFALYDVMKLILASFPEMRLIFCPILLGYDTNYVNIESPLFTIDHSFRG